MPCSNVDPRSAQITQVCIPRKNADPFTYASKTSKYFTDSQQYFLLFFQEFNTRMILDLCSRKKSILPYTWGFQDTGGTWSTSPKSTTWVAPGYRCWKMLLLDKNSPQICDSMWLAPCPYYTANVRQLIFFRRPRSCFDLSPIYLKVRT